MHVLIEVANHKHLVVESDCLTTEELLWLLEGVLLLGHLHRLAAEHKAV